MPVYNNKQWYRDTNFRCTKKGRYLEIQLNLLKRCKTQCDQLGAELKSPMTLTNRPVTEESHWGILRVHIVGLQFLPPGWPEYFWIFKLKNSRPMPNFFSHPTFRLLSHFGRGSTSCANPHAALPCVELKTQVPLWPLPSSVWNISEMVWQLTLLSKCTFKWNKLNWILAVIVAPFSRHRRCPRQEHELVITCCGVSLAFWVRGHSLRIIFISLMRKILTEKVFFFQRVGSCKKTWDKET